MSCTVSVSYLIQQGHRRFEQKEKGKRENGGSDGRKDKTGKKTEGERKKGRRGMRDDRGREHMQDGNYPLHRAI